MMNYRFLKLLQRDGVVMKGWLKVDFLCGHVVHKYATHLTRSLCLVGLLDKDIVLILNLRF